ncbi:MAG TPA: hypothetical protein GX696_07025 [Pseudomonadaceae bacterium]|nr:hypothetical protein [Pseudomonadaceae bacterium]
MRLNSEELLVNVTNLVNNANRLLSDENSAYVTRVLTNLDEVTSVLAAEQEMIRAGLRSLVNAGDNMSRLIATIEEQTLAHSEPILSRTAATLGNMERISQQLEQMLQENRGALNQGMQGIAEIDPAMRELRMAINSINRLVNRLSDDPAGFLTGGNNIREFQP